MKWCDCKAFQWPALSDLGGIQGNLRMHSTNCVFLTAFVREACLQHQQSVQCRSHGNPVVGWVVMSHLAPLPTEPSGHQALPERPRALCSAAPRLAQQQWLQGSPGIGGTGVPPAAVGCSWPGSASLQQMLHLLIPLQLRVLPPGLAASWQVSNFLVCCWCLILLFSSLQGYVLN